MVKQKLTLKQKVKVPDQKATHKFQVGPYSEKLHYIFSEARKEKKIKYADIANHFGYGKDRKAGYRLLHKNEYNVDFFVKLCIYFDLSPTKIFTQIRKEITDDQ